MSRLTRRAHKGERFGGRQKGTKNKATIERETKAAIEAAEAVERAKNSGRKLAKDMLDDFMHLFAGLAAKHQPLPPGAPIAPGAEPDEAKFEKWGRLAVQVAKDLAAFQSPTFKAIMVAPPPPDPGQEGQRKRFTLTIFEGPRPAQLEGPRIVNGKDAA